MIGVDPVFVTQEHVGTTIGAFVALEVKDGSPATDEQKNFVDVIARLGGRSGIVRSSADAMAVLRRAREE